MQGERGAAYEIFTFFNANERFPPFPRWLKCVFISKSAPSNQYYDIKRGNTICLVILLNVRHAISDVLCGDLGV